MNKMCTLLLSKFALVFVLIVSSVHYFATARGGEHKAETPGRRLLDDRESKPSAELAKGYMSNAELENAIMAFGERCSNISRIYSIGKSVAGVPLWVMEISDHPGREEPKPAFKFIGNVHGDEPVGRELIMLLANWLCDNYMKDPLAKLIVENVHLHLLPSMNPDGYALRKRGNANNIDLNRDFPDQFFPVNDVEDTRQPETIAIMRWLRRIQFTASATLHGGALVANYPWDGTRNQRKDYYACPDDETFRYLAGLYSHSHYNMSRSTEFPEGITNGAAWYPIYGGMQDWNYIYAGCLELTLEISDNKWPNASEIPTIWEYNRMSMLNLVATVVKTGVHGRIFSSDNGKPLAASIMIEGINHTVSSTVNCFLRISQSTLIWITCGLVGLGLPEMAKVLELVYDLIRSSHASSSSIFGSHNSSSDFFSRSLHNTRLFAIKARAGIADYHRLLVPGIKYEVKASMLGYKSKSTTIMLEEVTTLDFILEPEAFRTGKVVETACDCSENRKGSLEMVDILAHPQLEVSLVVIVTLAFLLLLLRRKLCSNLPKQRQLPVSKRPIIV